MAGIHHPTKGGSRGGTDQFDWEDVKVDKHRENYLGERELELGRGERKEKRERERERERERLPCDLHYLQVIH